MMRSGVHWSCWLLAVAVCDGTSSGFWSCVASVVVSMMGVAVEDEVPPPDCTSSATADMGTLDTPRFLGMMVAVGTEDGNLTLHWIFPSASGLQSTFTGNLDSLPITVWMWSSRLSMSSALVRGDSWAGEAPGVEPSKRGVLGPWAPPPSAFEIDALTADTLSCS